MAENIRMKRVSCMMEESDKFKYSPSEDQTGLPFPDSTLWGKSFMASLNLEKIEGSKLLINTGPKMKGQNVVFLTTPENPQGSRPKTRYNENKLSTVCTVPNHPGRFILGPEESVELSTINLLSWTSIAVQTV